MPTKTVKFKKENIDTLPNNKPIVYKIFNKNEENIYTGHSKKGQGQDRIKDHLPGGQDPVPAGVKVRIEQKQSVAEAQKSESTIIKRSQPKHNKIGK
ncbi:MAG: hypothetical protein HZC48_04635 [Nitrospirae bacterium]|nr:hypothetical protein [Nitrospirota bacterium]